jgi:hypothetical protein
MSKRGTRGGKSERHFIQIESQLHYVPSERWRRWIALGLLSLIAGRVAKPALPDLFGVDNGKLSFPPEPPMPWMNLNCRVIERHAIYDTTGPKLDPVVSQREIQRQYGD